MRGTIGHIVDTLAIFTTIVGVASTLGFGSAQINSGLTFLFNAPKSFWFQLIILIIATGLFIVSAWSGINNKKRSEEHTSELQSRGHLVCRLLLEKKNTF